MNDENPQSEEVDDVPFEGEPDFEDSPTTQHVDDAQDIVDEVQEAPDA